MLNAALYARVSTRDKGQTTENQLRELRAFAERLGYSVYKEYCDQESGSTLRRLRGEGLSFKKIQLATGVPVATMHKYLVTN